MKPFYRKVRSCTFLGFLRLFLPCGDCEYLPEIVECHFTTGKYDMFIKLYARNNHHLLSIIHDKLQPLGLARTETLISFHEAIKRQMPITVEEEED